jgi:uncharacterized protein (TIGR00255 family)
VIRSMTGFASISREEGGQQATVTIKSVNHRFLDLVIKAPQTLAPIENRIRSLVQQRLARGRIELSLFLEWTADLGREVVLNEPLLERVAQAIETAREKGLVSGGLTAADLLRIPQLLDIRQVDSASSGVSDATSALVEDVVVDALDALIVMRETEGRFLRADVDARLASLETLVDDVEREARDGQERLESKLRERLSGLGADVQGDPAAVAQEIVRFVARSDVDEELVRLRGHFGHWRTLADGIEPCGRKLDFLVQEMNREFNTVGSKAEGGRATEIVIAAKAELERVREQVQNVE